jgi:Na+/proline symporter
MSYTRFGAMIAVSTVVMFGLMYLNTFALDHVIYSQTRTWMALVMGAVMAAIMLGCMWSMYENRPANFAIAVGAAAVFVISLWLVRSQQTVDNVSYRQVMIPHHSIAILTNERAHIRDPGVRELADGIIETQEREISEMKRLIAARPPSSDAKDLPPHPGASAQASR